MFPGMFMRKPDKAEALKQLKSHVAMFGAWVVVLPVLEETNSVEMNTSVRASIYFLSFSFSWKVCEGEEGMGTMPLLHFDDL
uniref:Uncharacterized protein n=1 Tax=Salix viminalis TaxID=40686 RepID=A0A6N2LBN4_SALVM